MTESEKTIADHDKERRKVFGIAIDVFILGFVSLFTDISSEIFFTIFPLYLVSLGLSKTLIGSVEGIAEAVGDILKGVSGKIADVIGRNKGLIVLGYSLSNLVKPATGLASIVPTVDLKYAVAMTCRVSDRIGKGFRTSPRDAIISALSQKQTRGKSFGIHRTMDTTGAIVGPIIAAFLLAFSFEYTSIFMLTLLPGAIAIILVFFITDVPRKKTYAEVKNIKLPRSIYSLVLIVGMIEFFAANVSFVIIYAKEILNVDMNVALLYALYNLVYALIAIPAGLISDRYGRKAALVPGAMLFSLGYLIAATMFFGAHALIISFISLGIGRGLFDGNIRATIGDITPKEIRARAYGLYYLIIGVLSIVEASLFGYLWDMFGAFFAFMYSGIFTALAALLLILWRYKPTTSGA